MPLPDYYAYYGGVFSHLIERWNGQISFRRMDIDTKGFYLLENKIPLHIKYSSSRSGPWSFNFSRDHQTQHQNLFDMYGQCITAFACGFDGIAAVSHQQLRQILDDNFEEQESVTIRRRRKQMYSIKGRDGKLEGKVGQNSLTELVYNLTLNSERQG